MRRTKTVSSILWWIELRMLVRFITCSAGWLRSCLLLRQNLKLHLYFPLTNILTNCQTVDSI